MRRLMRLFRLYRRERGQIFVLSALMLVVLMGMSGLAVDVGILVKERRDLQKTVDAAALAGVQALPGCGNSTQAMTRAKEWAAKNYPDLEPSRLVVQVTDEGGYNCDTIRVTLTGTAEFTFMRVLGIAQRDVTTRAAARIGSLEASRHFMPWGLTKNNSDCLIQTNPPQPRFGATCTLKLGSQGGETGDRGALDIDGGGANGYRQNIIDSTTEYDYSIGDTIAALPGTKVGPTGQGLGERLTSREPSSYDGVACDTNGNGVDDFDEVFDDRGAGSEPRYAVRYGCSDSPRLVVIPIVDLIDSPQLSTIYGWALMYVNDWQCVDGSGPNCEGQGHWEVSGRIVDAVWSENTGIFGTYTPGQPAQWFLIE